MDGTLKNYPRVYVQRDYSNGMAVQFEKSIPRELENKISREQFEETISHINSLYNEAERLNCSTFCEGCFACLTSYLFLCCMKTHYEKIAKAVSQYLDEQNATIYRARGLYLVDPLQRGLRILEICILTPTENNALTI